MIGNNDEELEFDYLEDELYLDEENADNNSQDEYIELFEEIGEEDELDTEQDNIDNSEKKDKKDREKKKKENKKNKKKIPKNILVNRIMIIMGMIIGCFTIFYALVILDLLKKDPEPKPDKDNTVIEEQTTEVVEDIPEEPQDDSVFVSKYSDTNISQDVKDILNDASLDSMESGLSKLDLRVENVISKTVDEDKTIYENVRNIYDYFVNDFELTSKSYVDDDTIYEACSSVDYISFFDMELIYRANKALNKKSGSAEDLACALTVLFRNYGLEAYYINGEAKIDEEYEERGYTLVIIEDEYYIFDVAYEIENISDESNLELEYITFCKTFDEVSDIYTEEGVEESIDDFEEFDTLPQLTFNAEFTADNGGYTSGNVKYVKGYSASGNSDNAEDDIVIQLGEKVYLNGSVSGSYSNTWKLAVKVYDSNMNYITESVLYNVSTDSTTNSVTYTPSRTGYIKLNYMVTDVYGRTCTISTMIEVEGEEEISDIEDEESSQETTSQEETTEDESDTEQDESSTSKEDETSEKETTSKETTSKEPETSEKETTSKESPTDESGSSTELESPEETTSSFKED